MHKLHVIITYIPVVKYQSQRWNKGCGFKISYWLLFQWICELVFWVKLGNWYKFIWYCIMKICENSLQICLHHLNTHFYNAWSILVLSSGFKFVYFIYVLCNQWQPVDNYVHSYIWGVAMMYTQMVTVILWYAHALGINVLLSGHYLKVETSMTTNQ